MSSLKVAFYLSGPRANVRLKALHGLARQEGWGDCGQVRGHPYRRPQFLAFLSHERSLQRDTAVIWVDGKDHEPCRTFTCGVGKSGRGICIGGNSETVREALPRKQSASTGGKLSNQVVVLGNI